MTRIDIQSQRPADPAGTRRRNAEELLAGAGIVKLNPRRAPPVTIGLEDFEARVVRVDVAKVHRVAVAQPG
jgi:hypothetical protein